MTAIERPGVPFGREDSVKLEPTGIVTERVLVGFHAAAMPQQTMLAVCRELEMPPVYEQVLQEACARASVVLFGIEPRQDSVTVKAYLEFWDDVRQQVRATRSRAPRLLHLGVKWEPGHPDRHGLTRYVCHPLLSPAEAIGRMTRLMTGCDPRLVAAGTGLVGLAMRRAPQDTFLYLEAEDGAGPRRSYDINLYKARLRLSDALPWAVNAAQGLGLGGAEIEAVLRAHATRTLGHISAGQARDGHAFMTWYYEIEPLLAP
jgi:hypothetical protein